MTHLFIDPGSRSVGWALFIDREFSKSGTIKCEGKIADRLSHLAWKLERLDWELPYFDEVHVENFRMNLAMELHWSVGVIFSVFGNGATIVAQDIWMSSWQSFCDFEKGKPGKLLSQYPAESEDELSAIGMGLYYFSPQFELAKAKKLKAKEKKKSKRKAA